MKKLILSILIFSLTLVSGPSNAATTTWHGTANATLEKEVRDLHLGAVLQNTLSMTWAAAVMFMMLPGVATPSAGQGGSIPNELMIPMKRVLTYKSVTKAVEAPVTVTLVDGYENQLILIEGASQNGCKGFSLQLSRKTENNRDFAYINGFNRSNLFTGNIYLELPDQIVGEFLNSGAGRKNLNLEISQQFVTTKVSNSKRHCVWNLGAQDISLSKAN